MTTSQEQTIIQFLPHRAPMIMVDTLLDHNQPGIRTQFTIQSDNIFVEDGLFTTPGIIENIAQSVAADAGRKARMNAQNPPVGFLAGIKRLKVYQLPTVGSTITTEVHLHSQARNIGIFRGRVYCNDTCLIECEVTIVRA
ncbi:MAG: hypothetical protein D6714_10725 [Bacteroidetes bacterium]|nr:MAG: hypothetical protein D6714_10725 [Bacteroidota bacterium]